MDRREFSVALGLATAAGLVRPRALFGAGQRATVFEWETIGEGLHVAFGAGGNVLAVENGGSMLLVDTKNLGYGRVLREEAEAHGGTLRGVIITHHHGDHIGGTPFFTDQVPVFSQARGAPRAASYGQGIIESLLEDPVGRLERMNGQVRNMDIAPDAREAGSDSMAAMVAMAERLKPESFAATETFDRELERGVGDVRVEVRHIENGHTDNDAFVYVPHANLVHCGDLYFNGIHPYIDVGAGATTAGWQRNIDAMIEAGDAGTTYIPGHGPLTGVDGLRGFRAYFDVLRAFVRQQIDAGRNRDQIMEMQPPEFRDWPEARLNQNLGIIYDEITG